MRRIETGLARLTVGALVLYVPLETWVSLPHGLQHPMYLVDLIAMGLLLFGAVHSLRARPRCAPGPLCAGWAWAAANGWRATAWRWLDALGNDAREIEHGVAELWIVTVASAFALACFALSMALAVRGATGRPGDAT